MVAAFSRRTVGRVLVTPLRCVCAGELKSQSGSTCRRVGLSCLRTPLPSQYWHRSAGGLVLGFAIVEGQPKADATAVSPARGKLFSAR